MEKMFFLCAPYISKYRDESEKKIHPNSFKTANSFKF